ncbi:hypothetical protein GQ457_04G015400 [Hibiscus cannabinus]
MVKGRNNVSVDPTQFEELETVLKCHANLIKVVVRNSVRGDKDQRSLRISCLTSNNIFGQHIISEEDKVATASMYLSGDTKLWWCSKFNRGVYSIQTWDELKKELKNSFFLENVEYNARNKLKELSHTGIALEHVKLFHIDVGWFPSNVLMTIAIVPLSARLQS